MRHRLVHTSFQTWSAINAMLQQQEQRRKRAMKKWIMTTVYRSWLTWTGEVTRRKKYYAIVDKVMRRMKRMQVTKSFGKWMEEVDKRVHLRQRMVRESKRGRREEEECDASILFLFFSS